MYPTSVSVCVGVRGMSPKDAPKGVVTRQRRRTKNNKLPTYGAQLHKNIFTVFYRSLRPRKSPPVLLLFLQELRPKVQVLCNCYRSARKEMFHETFSFVTFAQRTKYGKIFDPIAFHHVTSITFRTKYN